MARREAGVTLGVVLLLLLVEGVQKLSDRVFADRPPARGYRWVHVGRVVCKTESCAGHVTEAVAVVDDSGQMESGMSCLHLVHHVRELGRVVEEDQEAQRITGWAWWYLHRLATKPQRLKSRDAGTALYVPLGTDLRVG